MRGLIILKALRHRPFRLLWLGQTVSRLGDSMHRVALVWWVLQTTGSGLAMGTVLIFQTIPLLLFVLFGGVVVDRFDRVRIMIMSDVVRAAITAFMAIFAFQDALELWHVYVASAVFGVVDAFFQPAYLAAVPKIARKEDLASANAVTSLSTQMTRVAGAALSGLCIAGAGTSLVFMLDAATFAISAAYLVGVNAAARREPLPPDIDDDFLGLSQNSFGGFTDPGTGFGGLRGGTVTFVRPQDMNLGRLSDLDVAPRSKLREFVNETRTGFRFVFSRVYLWMPIVVFCFVNALDWSTFTLAMPYLITRVYSMDIGAFATLQAVAAVGFGLVTIALGQRAKLPRRGFLLFAGVFVVGASALGVAAPITIYGVGAFVVVRAMAFSWLELTYMSLFQDKVPAEKLGRVFAIDSFLSTVLMPVGLALAGWATDRFDPRAVFFVNGVLVILVSLGFRHRGIRKLK